MTEREFLERFIRFVYYLENKSHWVLAIDNFLEAVHSEYYETKFVKMGHNCTFDEDGKFQHDLQCDGCCKTVAGKNKGAEIAPVNG